MRPASSSSRDPETDSSPRVARRIEWFRVTGLLAAIIVAGIPFVAYLWETLNQIFALHIEPRRLLIAAPLLVVFFALLRAVGRAFARLDVRAHWMGE